MVTTNDFVNKVQKALHQLEKKRGRIAVFALFKMDDYIDKWTVIVGAKWVNGDNFRDIYSDLRTDLFDTLDEHERTQIVRFGIFDLEDHLVEDCLKKHSVGVKDVPITIKNEPLNGNQIHVGYILRSDES